LCSMTSSNGSINGALQEASKEEAAHHSMKMSLLLSLTLLELFEGANAEKTDLNKFHPPTTSG